MMQQLFLGSAALGALPTWLADVVPVGATAIVVPTASNRMPSAPFVAAAARLLRASGLVVEWLDLEQVATVSSLDGARLVFFTGGDPILLARYVRRTGFDRIVVPAVRCGNLAYAGISAGAELAGPDLRWFREDTEPDTPGSIAGLGIVSFTVLPHLNRDRAGRYERMMADFPDVEFVMLNDNQAVTVDGVRRTLLDSGPYR